MTLLRERGSGTLARDLGVAPRRPDRVARAASRRRARPRRRAGQMGLLAAAALLPHLLFSLPAGVWLDRVASRRRVMIASDLARAALVGTIPLAYALDVLTLAQLYAVAFLAGSLAVLFDSPTRRSSCRLRPETATSRGTRSSTAAVRFRSWRAPPSAACSSRRSARPSPCSATRSRSSSRRSSSGVSAPRSRRSSTRTSGACARGSPPACASSAGTRSSGPP